MEILFTHKINSLSGKNSLDGFDFVITRVIFKLIGTINNPFNITHEKYCVVLLDKPITNNFIPYSAISEENVISWVKSNKSYDWFCVNLSNELLNKIGQNQEEIKEFDFENYTFPWMENPL